MEPKKIKIIEIIIWDFFFMQSHKLNVTPMLLKIILYIHAYV